MTRRPLDEGTYRITQDLVSADNIGTDYGCNMFTPIKAPFAGRVSRTNLGDARRGIAITVTRDDGAMALIAHLADFTGGQTGTVAEGAPIARSGNSGMSTGPHAHVWVQWRGRRYTMEQFLVLEGVIARVGGPYLTTTAGNGIELIQEDDMLKDEVIRELKVSDYGQVAQEINAANALEWVFWFAKRGQMLLDGQLPSVALDRIVAVVEQQGRDNAARDAALGALVDALGKQGVKVDQKAIVDAAYQGAESATKAAQADLMKRIEAGDTALLKALASSQTAILAAVDQADEATVELLRKRLAG